MSRKDVISSPKGSAAAVVSAFVSAYKFARYTTGRNFHPFAVSFSDPLMTKSDVAALLRCCERTVERQVKLGEFPPPQRFGKESLWFESIVHGWLDKRREQQQQWMARQQSTAIESPAELAAPMPPSVVAQTPKKPAKSRVQPWKGQIDAAPMFQVSAS